MANTQNFRSAFNGFNREDVVRYIELINNKHSAHINQLNNEMQALYNDLDAYRRHCDTQAQALAQLEQTQAQLEQTQAQLEQTRTNCAALEQELADVKQQLEEALARPQPDTELDIYRRAAQAEYAANERINRLYSQANGILAEATTRTDSAAANISQITEKVCMHLNQLQTALSANADSIRDTAAAMYSIKPISNV